MALRGGADGGVVLRLFAYEEAAHFAVVHHVGHLRPATGSLEGNGDRTHAIAAEGGEEAFGLVLRKDGDALAALYA